MEDKTPTMSVLESIIKAHIDRFPNLEKLAKGWKIGVSDYYFKQETNKTARKFKGNEVKDPSAFYWNGLIQLCANADGKRVLNISMPNIENSVEKYIPYGSKLQDVKDLQSSFDALFLERYGEVQKPIFKTQDGTILNNSGENNTPSNADPTQDGPKNTPTTTQLPASSKDVEDSIQELNNVILEGDNSNDQEGSNSAQEEGNSNISKLLQELLNKRKNASQTAEEVHYLLEYDGVKTISTCDYQLMIAKKKQGKTTALAVLMSAVLGSNFGRLKALQENATILHFDTEQNENDHLQTLKYINLLCGKDEKEDNSRINSFSLLGYSPEDKRLLLEQSAQYFRPSLIVIDGIIQFVKNPENEGENRLVIDLLDRIKSECKCAILVVIHSNKSMEDDNARYSLGTNLENGCADRFNSKVDTKGIFTLHHEYSRHTTFENDLCYVRDRNNNGLPVICNNDIVKIMEERQRKKYEPIAIKLRSYVGTDGKSSTELITYIGKSLGYKETESKNCIKFAVDNNFIKKSDGYRGKYIAVSETN